MWHSYTWLGAIAQSWGLLHKVGGYCTKLGATAQSWGLLHKVGGYCSKLGATAQSFRQLQNYCLKRCDTGMFKKGNIYIYCVHAMKAWGRSRGMAPLILTSVVSGVRWLTPPPRKYRASIEKVAGWTLEPLWMFWRKVAPAGIRTPIHV